MLGRMLSAVLAVFVAIQSAAPQQTNPLHRLDFLVGHWTGEGSGTPGNSLGEFSFEWDLKQNVLIRRSFAEYPATKDRPASRHDDFMIVFAEDNKLKADYFDTEGHVIRYSITSTANGNEIQFLSDAVPRTPRYRLTYTKGNNPTSMKLKFEISSPDKPDAFASYIDATLHRK